MPMYGTAHRPPRPIRACQPFMLCIAQHRQNKNVPLALRIFAQTLRAKILPRYTRFLLLGINGPDTRRILNEVRNLDLGDRVVILSGISDQELLWCYRNCCLLLAPSSIEGFGLPVAEALMAGCPVVCSDIPAFREIGGNRCRYVAFGESLMAGYMKAIQQTLAETWKPGESMPEFAPTSIGGKYMDLYRRLSGFPIAVQSGTLLHSASETPINGIPS